MPIYTKESLEMLRQRIDLPEVLASHIELKRSGAAYKALCPFHDEKTPSFTIQRGDHHYHCFGCGAHGDAIQFLMMHVKMSFSEAIESLAQRFNVVLQEEENTQKEQGPSKAALKEALEQATRLFQFLLLHTTEGEQALRYLYSRGLDLKFIRQFRIGLAPKSSGILRPWMHSKFIKDAALVKSGLISESGHYRDFFIDRIMFPICDAQGAVIAFSGRKYKEETYGGKYVNTPETALFKKSRVLFGLHYCRKRIVKERQAIIVEGQLDALRLISHGFTISVAGQGTAFGEGHAKELLQLGVNKIYLAMDSDLAGGEAACKIGDLFQREGVEVFVLSMPLGSDPDSFLCEKGPDAFSELLTASSSYLEFVVKHRSQKINLESPAGKTELVQLIARQIRDWKDPLMVHESLRQLAFLVQVPEHIVGSHSDLTRNVYIKKGAFAGQQTVDPDRILEFDLLRWLLLLGNSQPELLEIAKRNLKIEDFKFSPSRAIYQAILANHASGQPCDFLGLAASLEDLEAQELISEILERKVNKERCQQQFEESLQSLLERNWMEQREQIRVKIQDSQCSDEEAMELARQFDALKRSPPKIKD